MWLDIDDAEFVRERLNVPGCQILAREDRDVFRPDRTLKSHDSRFLVSSLDPSTLQPSDFHKLLRGHWQVENCLHFVKDRWWDEDRHYLKQPGLGDVFVELTNAALSLLRLLQKTGDSLRETAENFHYSPRKILRILGFNIA